MNLHLWVAAGSFIAGLLSGVVFRDALDIYRASRKERSMTSSRNKIGRGLIVALSVALVLNFGLGLLLVQQRATGERTAREGERLARDLATYSNCTNKWQQDFATGYQARYDAAVLVSEAMDGVVGAVAAQDPEKFRAAIARYLKVREQQNADREKTPLPPLPDQLCGTAPKGAD